MPITPDDFRGRKVDPALFAWLVTHYDTLHDGYWPDLKIEEVPTREGAYSGSWQRNPSEWAAETMIRKDKCGFRGTLMWLYYHDGMNTEEMARKFNMRETKVIKDINIAVRYCSGRNFRRITIEQYANHSLKRNGGKTDI